MVSARDQLHTLPADRAAASLGNRPDALLGIEATTAATVRIGPAEPSIVDGLGPADLEPVILDPNDPAFADTTPRIPLADLLTVLAVRSAAALATATPAQDLLREAGITDPSTWSAFRLGAGDESLAQGIDPDAWAHCKALGLRKQSVGFVLAGPGINIPTYDPRDTSRVVGVVRIIPAQTKSRFATAPAGLACAADINDHRRVVLADAPVLALKLHQAGVRDVALVEDIAVLTPLLPWLGERQIVVVSHKKAGLTILRDALGPLAGAATSVQLQGDLKLSSEESLAVLGLTRGQFQTVEQLPAMDTRSLHHLHAYAQGRLVTTEGLAALDLFGANQPDLVDIYRLGYLPADFRAALDTATKRMLNGLHCGNSVVIPALDRDGVIVDLLMKYAAGSSSRNLGLFPEPRGMLAPVISTSFDEVIITTSMRALCGLWQEGRRNVLLMRGLADVHQNAARLREAGVRVVNVYTTARQRSRDIIQVLRDNGFTVEVMRGSSDARSESEGEPELTIAAHDTASAAQQHPAPILFPSPAQVESAPAALITVPSSISQIPLPAAATVTNPGLDLVEHDEVSGLATFRAGTAVLVVEVPWDTSSRLEVTLRHNGEVHRDRFDVAVAAQRRRFASSATLKTAVAVELIDPLLIALLDAVRALVAEKEGKAQSPALLALLPSDHAAAMESLTAPDLLERIRADLAALGWVAEDESKELLYLAATSRKLASPIWASLMASPGAGKSHGLDLIAELTPPEDLVQVSRLTDAALYHQQPGGLSHKLLVIDEADALTAEVIIALRVLKTRGALSLSHADRSGPAGQVRTVTIEVRGPVAVLTSTAGTLEPQLLSRCVEVPVDESPEQTQRILATQQRMHADPGWMTAGGRREAIIARHRTMQRLLASAPVVIPYAERIEFPATSVRHRREHERFLGLIEASALLHQHQRLKDQGTIVATEADFAVASRLVARQLAASHQGLGQHARSLLELLVSSGVVTATMEDLSRLRPEWNRYHFLAALKDLMALDFVTSTGGGRGRRREYRLLPSGVQGTLAPKVRLRAVGELADVGETDFYNVKPTMSAG